MSDTVTSGDGAGVSRRDILKGAGAAAFFGAVGTHAAQAEPTAKIRRIGPGPVAIDLSVNGKKRRLNLEPRVTLLDALRDRMDSPGPSAPATAARAVRAP